MQHSIICIFTDSGNTFTFRDIEILHDNESVIQFSYRAMSDGLEKIATFPKANICGWSLTEMQIHQQKEVVDITGKRDIRD